MTTSGEGSGRDVFAAIRDRAFRAVRPDRLGQTNLYLDQRVCSRAHGAPGAVRCSFAIVTGPHG